MKNTSFMLLTDEKKFETLITRVELLEEQLEQARKRIEALEGRTTTSDLSGQIQSYIIQVEGRVQEKIDSIESRLNSHIVNS